MPARAQTPCAPLDTTAGWYQRQRDWLRESDSTRGSDPAFRALLLAAAGLDPALALPVQLGYDAPAVGAAPATPSSGRAVMAESALVRLRTLAADRRAPWPTRSAVGAAGVRAVWVLAARDTALQRTILHRMMESGPDEALAADVAVLEDRLRIQAGRKQIYGTQQRLTGAGVVLAPMEDSAHVDLRRDAAGLPPLAVARCAKAGGAR